MSCISERTTSKYILSHHKYYLNSVSTSAMTGSHITIALCNSSRDSQISVLTVHVVGTRTRIITKPDTKVLDLQWASVMDLVGN